MELHVDHCRERKTNKSPIQIFDKKSKYSQQHLNSAQVHHHVGRVTGAQMNSFLTESCQQVDTCVKNTRNISDERHSFHDICRPLHGCKWWRAQILTLSQSMFGFKILKKKHKNLSTGCASVSAPIGPTGCWGTSDPQRNGGSERTPPMGKSARTAHGNWAHFHSLPEHEHHLESTHPTLFGGTPDPRQKDVFCNQAASHQWSIDLIK